MPRNQFIMKLVLVLASLCILSRISAETSENTWQRLLSNKGGSLAPEATQSVLQELDAAYAAKNDPASLGIKFQVKALLEASRISQSKCNKDSLEQIDSLISTFSAYKLSVIPFLEHYKSQQVKLCKGDDLDEDRHSSRQESATFSPLDEAEPDSFEEDDRQEQLRGAEQVRALAAKIFSPKAQRLSPSETFAILEQLSGIALDGYQFPEEWELLDKAIELRYIYREPAVCFSHDLAQIDSELRENAELVNTVVPLLEESRRKVLNFCKAEAKRQLQEDLSRIPAEAKNKISFLSNKARDGDLAAAVKSYLKEWAPKVAKTKSLEKFREEVKAVFMKQDGLCRYTTSMRDSTYVSMLAKEGKSIAELGPDFEQWRANKKVCKELDNRAEEVIAKVYSLLKSDKGGLFGR